MDFKQNNYAKCPAQTFLKFVLSVREKINQFFLTIRQNDSENLVFFHSARMIIKEGKVTV